MGLYLENIQIFVDKGSSQTRNQIVEAVRKIVSARGLQAAEDHETPEVTISIGPKKGRWIAVHLGEYLDIEDFRSISSELNSLIGLPLVTVNVADSDVLVMELIENASVSERYCSDLELAGLAPSDVTSGDGWAKFISTEKKSTLDELFRKAFDSEDDRLVKIGKLFKISSDCIFQGIDQQDYYDPSEKSDDIYLDFRRTIRPASENLTPTKAPTLALFDGHSDPAFVDSELETTFKLSNGGDPAVGLKIELSGPTFSSNQAELRDARVTIPRGRRAPLEFRSTFVKDENSENSYSASFSNVVLDINPAWVKISGLWRTEGVVNFKLSVTPLSAPEAKYAVDIKGFVRPADEKEKLKPSWFKSK